MKLIPKLMPALLLLFSLGLAAQTKVNLNKQSTPPGSSGQLLYNNNGVTDAEDPLISWNYVNLINVGNATGTITGSAVRNPIFSSYGTLFVTFASIGGSPSGCTLQIVAYDSLGNSLNSGSTVSVTAANGTTSYIVAPAIALPTAAKLSATFACSVYPTGSPTISVDFVPASTTAGMWAQPATSSDTLSATYAGGSSCTTHACVAVNSTGYGSSTVWIEGTYTGSTVNFEMQRDGSTTWFPVACSQDDGTAGATSVALPSNQTRAYSCGVYGTTQFRVRQSALGTGSPVVGVTLTAAPIEPFPNVAVTNSITQGNAGSNGQAWWNQIGDTANGPVAVKPAIATATIPPTFTSAGASNANPALTAVLSPNSGIPPIVQKTSGTGSSGQASLATSNFGSAVTAGNSLVVVAGVGNNGSVKITDTLANSFTQDVCQLNGTTFQVCIFHATNIIGGTDAVTVTPSASVSLDIAAYEVAGLIGVGGGGSPIANSSVNQQGSFDAIASGSGSSVTPDSGGIGTVFPNEIAFGGIAIGTANQTPSAFIPWNKDFSLAVGGSPSGLFGLHTFSQPLGVAVASLELKATITSEPWAAAVVSFKSAPMGAVQGQVSVIPALQPPSYRAAKKYALSSTTDIACLPGNATTVVWLTKIKFTCTQTTAGMVNLEVALRSTADSGGTSANFSIAPDDTYPAASSTPLSYTGAGPTVNSTVADIDYWQGGCLASATAAANDIYIGNFQQKPVVLRGTGQEVCLNLGGAVTGGNGTVTFEWIESK